MFVKPEEARRVIDPTTYRVLPPEGGEVSENTYWLRRVACGDVERVSEEAAPQAKPGKNVSVDKIVGAE